MKASPAKRLRVAPIVFCPISGCEMDRPGRSLVLTVGHRFPKAIRIESEKIDQAKKFLEWHSSLGSGLFRLIGVFFLIIWILLGGMGGLCMQHF